MRGAFYEHGINATLVFIAVFFLVALLVVAIFYLITLQNTLKTIAPHNRRMPADNVWLLLIPLFGTFYQFYVVRRIAESIAAEYREREIPTSEELPTYQLGLAMNILNLISVLPIPFVSTVLGLGGFVCWIVYWVKIAGIRRVLQQTSPAQSI